MKKISIAFLVFAALLWALPESRLEYKVEPPKPAEARILFAGDLMFDRGIRFYAGKNGGNDFIFSEISNFLQSNDLNIANLEGPITKNPSVSSGTAPGSANNYIFTFDPSEAKTLAQNNIKIVGIGNNHILNFGAKGLEETKNFLDRAGVGYFGSPNYPRSISAEIKGLKITFVGYNQFSNLGIELEQKAALEEIEKTKGFSDLIMVFCHWGSEYAALPEAEDVGLARRFIDRGADFVAGSHPHVIQPSETYNGKKIYYSLGNFIFDQYFDEQVRKGMGVVLKINPKTSEISFEEINFYLQDGGQTIIIP